VRVVDALEPVSFQKGDNILTEGELGETFYIIEEGSVTVQIKGEVMATKSKGEYFGGSILFEKRLETTRLNPPFPFSWQKSPF